MVIVDKMAQWLDERIGWCITGTLKSIYGCINNVHLGIFSSLFGVEMLKLRTYTTKKKLEKSLNYLKTPTAVKPTNNSAKPVMYPFILRCEIIAIN